MLSLNLLAARERTRDFRAAARTAPVDTVDPGASPVTRVTLRFAAAKDAPALRWLAELDSAAAPGGAVLVAEVDGRLRAALPLDGGPAIADPFHRGAELVELLRIRARQLARAATA